MLSLIRLDVYQTTLPARQASSCQTPGALPPRQKYLQRGLVPLVWRFCFTWCTHPPQNAFKQGLVLQVIDIICIQVQNFFKGLSIQKVTHTKSTIMAFGWASNFRKFCGPLLLQYGVMSNVIAANKYIKLVFIGAVAVRIYILSIDRRISFSFMLSRLSYSFLPLAREMLSFA